jgi:hypothetical protein
MGTSSIAITALTATPTLRGNKLKATVSATGPAANLPNLMLKTVVFKSSTVNDYTTATEIARGNPEALDAGLIEEQTYYYWAYAVDNSDSPGPLFPVSPTAGVACTAIGMSGLAFGLANGTILATHNVPSSNQLTIALKTAAGNDPSPADPVYAAFRKSTLSVGGYQIREIISALSIVLPNGSACNPGGNSPFRNWVGLLDDSGTVKFAVEMCSNGFGVYSLADGDLASASAAGGAFSLYAATTVTAKPLSVIGYLEWSSGLSTTAWTADPDIIVLRNAGTKLPGEIVQRAFNSNSGYQAFSVNANIPVDDTKPQQASEGNSFFNVPITPRSSVNMLLHEFEATLTRSTDGPVIAALMKGGASDALATRSMQTLAGKLVTLKGTFLEGLPGTAAANYAVNFGGSGGATIYINGDASGRLFGGTLVIQQSITEIMG